VLFTERFVAPEQFPVDLREFFEQFIKLIKMGDALAGALLLFGTFKQEFLDLTGRQALGQIVKWSVLLPVVTTAIGLAALAIAFNEGGAHEVRVDGDLMDDGGFALAQGQSGSAAGREYPSHKYG
jgi:hypothetical protein